jgi:putative oxidoreductase
MDWMGSMGMPKALAPLIGVLELVGGIFLVVGLLTSLVSILFALEFAGICVQGKKMGKKSLGDYEKDLLFLGGALAMLFLGAGSLSLDRLLGI